MLGIAGKKTNNLDDARTLVRDPAEAFVSAAERSTITGLATTGRRCHPIAGSGSGGRGAGNRHTQLASIRRGRGA